MVFCATCEHPCCDFCIHVIHEIIKKADGSTIKCGPIGCKLHEDEEHQAIARDCYYCDDFHCSNAEKGDAVKITKEVWKDVLDVLEKHSISYTTHYKRRDVEMPMECPNTTVDDKHIQINLVIPDYFGDRSFRC